jgi:hypothetical protein
LINFLIFNFGHFCLKFKKKYKKIQIQILDTRHKLQGFKLQFEIYLVPTKPLVVPENLKKLIQILMGRTVYVINVIKKICDTFCYKLAPIPTKKFRKKFEYCLPLLVFFVNDKNSPDLNFFALFCALGLKMSGPLQWQQVALDLSELFRRKIFVLFC